MATLTEKSPIVIYLSGPMSGIPDFNVPEFTKYAKKYRDLGFTVISPAELDNGETNHPYEFYLKRDIQKILDSNVTRMYMMPGWHKSKGANFEKHMAEILKIEIWNAETGKPYKENIAQEAQRLVFNDRGAVYSHPFDDFGRTAGMANAAFKSKLKEDFTQEDIAVLMMLVKISRLINSPDHRDSLVDLPGYGLCYELVRQRRKELESK